MRMPDIEPADARDRIAKKQAEIDDLKRFIVEIDSRLMIKGGFRKLRARIADILADSKE